MSYDINGAAIAAASSTCRYRVGAMVVGKSVWWGYNKRKTHPWLKKYKYKEWSCVHAELDALLKAHRNADVEGSSLYVARLMRDNKWGMAKPCEGCMGVIVELGIKEVFYSTGRGSEVKRMAL